MSRIWKLLALTAVLALAVAGAALAATMKVTGGTTTITASSAAATVLADNHVTITPIAPATASGATFTFNITGGHLNTKTLRGVIRHSGGVKVSNATKSVALRRLTIVSSKRGVSVFALARRASHRVCSHFGRHHARIGCIVVTRLRSVRIARVSDVSVSNGKATGTVKITAYTAALVNRLAGKHVVSAGDMLGSATVAPTLK